jgi:serine phosphatase RsbU (regulator of sigma subunit)/anti-sigma regulatory factor (Ser/Thr protein kinase)
VKGRNDLVASAAYRPEPAAVAAARKFVRDTLQSWLPMAGGPAPDSGLVDDAVLLTSELVTNAVVHAGTDVQVTCKLAGDAVEVVIRDSHPARMVPGPVRDDRIPAERTGGRGLLLPSALASAWGVSYGTDTKAVWFRMRFDGQQARQAEPGTDPDGPGGVVPVRPPDAWRVRALPPERPGGTGPVLAGPEPARGAGAPGAGAGPRPGAEPGYDDLLRQCVAAARVLVAADAGYALVADEDGNLTVRASAGISPAALLRSAPSVTTVPFLVDGRVTGVLAVAAMLPGRFGDSDVQRLQQLADSMATVLERSRLAELEQARRARMAVLAGASELPAASSDAEGLLAGVNRVVVPRLAEWCAVLLGGPEEDLRVAVARHADAAAQNGLAWVLEHGLLDRATLDRGILDRGALDRGVPDRGALDRGRPGLAWPKPAAGGSPWRWPLGGSVPPGAPPGAADLAAQGAWCFPLTGRGGPLGLLVLGGPHAGRPSREVLSLAQDVAGRVALGLENLRLAAAQQAGQRATRAALVPAELPAVPGFEVAMAHDLPGAGEAAAGDFCDVFQAAAGRWRFAIGEVCGAGPATLAVTSLVRATLRVLGEQGHSVPDVLNRLNRLVLQERAPGAFLTLIHGEILPGAPARLFLACAGQPLPLVLRAPADSLDGAAAAEGRPMAPDGHDGLPAVPVAPAVVPQPVLGVIDGLGFAAQPVVVSPGDLLLCVTDGVTRRRDGDRLFDDDDGLARLLSGCAGLTADVVADKVHEEVRSFGGRPAADGMAVLALRATR